MASPSPFSIYASAFLNRGNASQNLSASQASTSQPLFYSATAAGAGDDGSDDGDPFTRGGDETPGARSIVGDDSVPHLPGGEDDPQSVIFDAGRNDDHDSPYLEDRDLGSSSRNLHPQSMSQLHNDDEDEDDDVYPGDLDDLPMMDSEMYDHAPRVRTEASTTQSTLNDALTGRQPGWKSHHALPPQSPPRQQRQQLPLSPLHDSRRSPVMYPYSDEEEEDYDDNEPPAFLVAESISPSPPRGGHHQQQRQQSHAPPPTTRTAMSVQMNESLLPRDGVSRSLFFLPDPDRPVGRNKYHDAEWMTVWLAALSICALGSVMIFFLTDSSPKPKDPDPNDSVGPIPYSTLTHTIPLLTMLTLASAGVSYGYLILFRFAVRPMLILTAISTPLFLFLASAYAFSGSFFSEEGVTPTWGETVGLRLFSVIPLGFAYLSAKSFYKRYESLVQTASVVELSTSLLLTHPSILLLSLAILIVCFIASIPFLSLAMHLLLIGYFSHPSNDTHVWVWHVRNWAGTLCLFVVIIWLWSWAIARGTMRVVVAGVVGNWYFTAHDPVYTVLSQQEATRAALSRATGPSLGSICAGSLTIATVQASVYVMRWARRLTTPPQLQPFAPLHPLAFLSSFIASFDTLSTYALTYIGITGEGFWNSAKRARGIVANHGSNTTTRVVGEEDEEEELITNRRRRGRTPVRRVSDYTMVSNLLSLSALSIAVFSAVGGYVFAAHTLAGPTNAPLAALTCGIVTFLTVKFGLGLGEDAADAVYICYNIDVQGGTKHRAEVFEVFEGRQPLGPIAV